MAAAMKAACIRRCEVLEAQAGQLFPNSSGLDALNDQLSALRYVAAWHSRNLLN